MGRWKETEGETDTGGEAMASKVSEGKLCAYSQGQSTCREAECPWDVKVITEGPR